MALTEEEAKTKWCHRRPRSDYPDIGPEGGSFCIGSKCMAWRWQRLFDDKPAAWFGPPPPEIKPTHGYCGLAGPQP